MVEWNDNKLVIDIEIFVCSKFNYHWKFDSIYHFLRRYEDNGKNYLNQKMQ